jgi:putative hydrolase of the HAD superfamily
MQANRGRVWLFRPRQHAAQRDPAHLSPHQPLDDRVHRTASRRRRKRSHRIRQDYWVRYGATLLGLMRHHGTDPDTFLQETHQFPDLKRMLVFEKP